MKKLIFTLVLIASFSLSAQDNVAKLNVLALPFNNASFAYERFFNDYISLNAGFGMFLPQKVADQYTTGTSDVKRSGYHVTPELRIYPSGERSGFFVAPHVRYSNYGVKLDLLDYTEPTANTNYQLDMKAYHSEFGVGAQLGYHWIFGEVFSLDWFFAGPRYSFMKTGIKVSGSNAIADWEDVGNDVTNELSSIPGNVINVDSGNNNVNVSVPWRFVGFRTGLSLGIAF